MQFNVHNVDSFGYSMKRIKARSLYWVLEFSHLADESRLKQVLINRLGSAIQFTEKGSVTLNVKIHEFGSDNLSIKFTVIDTGIGIAKENLDKLFAAFSQADASMTRRFGSTGLGLAISSK